MGFFKKGKLRKRSEKRERINGSDVSLEKKKRDLLIFRVVSISQKCATLAIATLNSA